MTIERIKEAAAALSLDVRVYDTIHGFEVEIMSPDAPFKTVVAFEASLNPLTSLLSSGYDFPSITMTFAE